MKKRTAPLKETLARRGVLDMLIASVLFALMGNGVYACTLLEDPVPAATVSFIRVMVNLIVVLIPAFWTKDPRLLFGDLRPSLWLRGFFGGTALMLSFMTIQRIGAGESSFLTATNGVWIALLSPFLLQQKNRLIDGIAVIGAVIGLYLLLHPDRHLADPLGRWLGLLSAFLMALAYLMVARAGRSNTPTTIIFYFCLMSLPVHALWFWAEGWQTPQSLLAWTLSLLAGAAGSLAQFFLTRAYQRGPATLISTVGSLSPALSMGLSMVLFELRPDNLGLLGCGLILVSGLLLPWLRTRPKVPFSPPP